MKIYIMQYNRMYTFLLPKVISGNYIITDYDENGDKRSLVSVEEENGKWVMYSNSSIQIVVNGTSLLKTELNLYGIYQLLLGSNELINLYIGPAIDYDFISRKMAPNTTVTLGNNKADILYNNPIIAANQISIQYTEGIFYFKNLNPKIPVYVNKVNVIEKVIEKLDVIFILGVRIIIYGDNLLITNINNSVSIATSVLLDDVKMLAIANIDNKGEIYTDFYDEKDYYWKTPVFQTQYKPLHIKISPPPSVTKNDSSIIMNMVPSILMSGTSIIMALFSFGDLNSPDPSTRKSAIMSVVMCGTMLLGSIVWPFIQMFITKITTKIKNVTKRKKFIKYLNKKDQLLKTTISEQRMTLVNNNVSLKKCQEIIYGKTSFLFYRNIDNKDFLNVRLGIGTIPIDCTIDYTEEDFVEEEDKLLNRIKDTINNNKYIDNVPTTVSLIKRNKIAFISEDNNNNYYLPGIILQLVTLHSYNDLKIVIFTSEKKRKSFDYMRRIPHLWSNDYSIRFFATNQRDAQTISTHLESIYNRRVKLEGDYKKKLPYYLIISDDIDEYRNLKIIQDILSSNVNQGFSTMILDSKVANVPIECSYFVNYSIKEGACFENVMNESEILHFTPEFINEKEVNLGTSLAYLANIPVKTVNSVVENLTDRFGFLEMFSVGKVEQLNISNRWKNSNIVNSLSTPVGIDATGNLINLDLHEKFHGPHGLIAGMTGSGKSEFIITYILSLSINYSPNEVQFVLIDYKGGGLAGAFENRKTKAKLPHLVGTITNLDKAEMNRTLVSIKSELQKRQRLFNEAKEKLNSGTIDIYKYQKLVREGKLDLPLAHLFIICDEFAELKAQQPDFMDELVSAARIGRSLGVHLILATQKPSGVVNDQIWSNSKFKICCKVQTTEDSNEMLRKPDAAYIKEAGRFYLLVGYDESYIMGQSAYSGSPYVPSTKPKAKVDNTIDFINEVGEVVRSIEEDDDDTPVETVNLGEELVNVIAYIIDTSKKLGYKPSNLWLDNIPHTIYLDNIRNKYNISLKAFDLNPLIGEYDDPKHQFQGPVQLPITSGGNTSIIGLTGSGKTTLLTTIIYSIITSHKVEEVNFFIIDLVAEQLMKFAKAPQVSEVLTINDKNTIIKLFYYLQKVVEKRINYYSVNGGSFNQDIQNGNSRFPNIVVVINGIDIFKEQLDDLYNDVFIPFTRDCTRNGITFIVTGTGINSLGMVVENYFPQHIVMRLLDTSDYNMFFQGNRIVPSSNPGRGLIKLDDVYEFQTSLIFDYNNFDKNLNYVIQQLNQLMPKRAQRIPSIPNFVTIESFKNESIALNMLPIGFEIKSASPYFFDFSKFINIVLYKKEQSAKNFLPAIIDLLSSLNNVKNIVLSAYDFLEINNENVKFYKENFKNVLNALKSNLEKLSSDTTNNNTYIITVLGITKLNIHMKKLAEESDNIVNLDDIILLASNNKNIHFILVDNISSLRSVDDYPWYNLIDDTTGLILSAGFDDQEIFVSRSYYGETTINRDEAIAVNDGVRNYIKYVNK